MEPGVTEAMDSTNPFAGEKGKLHFEKGNKI